MQPSHPNSHAGFVAAPASVLVIRPGAIGDIVMASGLAVAMRAAWPQARIDWLVRPAYAGLLRHHPCLDTVIPLPFTTVSGSPTRWLHGARMLRQAGYELVVDAQGLLKSALVARLTGARRRVGLHSREGGNPFMTSVVVRPPSGGVMAAEYRALSAALGLDPQLTDPFLAMSGKDRDMARSFLRENGVHGPYVVLCPFTTRPQKHWPEGHWQRLRQVLERDSGLAVVVMGGPGDAAAAERVVAGDGMAVSAAGRTRLSTSAALIAGAALVIGVDTGLTHMGTAFRRPTIALFGSTRPYTTTPCGLTRVLYRDLDCAPCRRHPTCGGAFPCLAGLGPEQVLEAVASLPRMGR
ncbi:MAG: glycosyltransferase family 9 protein [Aquisalimonadaceae bacterium]